VTYAAISLSGRAPLGLSRDALCRRIRLLTLEGALEVVSALELDLLDVPELALALAGNPSLQLGLALSESGPKSPEVPSEETL